MKPTLEFISNIIPITGNSNIDTLLFFVIGIVAFSIAWLFTGDMSSYLNYDSNSMSIVHWIARISIFLGLMFLAIGIVHFVRWFLSLQWWIYLILGLSLILLIGGIVSSRFCNKKAKKVKK